MKFRLDLNLRLLLLGTLPAGLIALTLAGYFIHTRFQDLDTALTENGRLLARHLASAGTLGLVAKNQAALQSLANSTLLENDVVSVSIFQSDGTLIAYASNTQQGQNQVITNPVADHLLTFMTTAISNDVLSQTQNLNAVGNVSITLSKARTSQSQWNMLRNSLLFTLTGLVGTGILAYRIGKRVSEPIHSLTDSVTAIAKGNLDTRASFKADNPELNALKSGFNLMAISLQKNQENLERQVLHATKRFQKSLVSLESQNAELEKGQKHAENQNKIKSQFLAHISHEIRTPMNGIVGFTELLEKSELNEEQRSMLQLIDTSANNLLAIINDVLDLSTLESGNINLKIQDFHLRSHLEDAVALLVPKYTRVRLILLITPEVPQIISGDPIRIQQVIINLLGNAVKFTRQGQIVIRVRIHQYQRHAYLLFSVSDTGCGIPEQNRKKLFSPFHQTNDFAIDQVRGTGLGLAISKNIVEQMQGKIGVSSRTGLGSTFWFAIPLKSHPNPIDVLPHFDVVLTDDSPLSRQAFTYQLQALGASVTPYNALQAYVDANQQGTPSISLLVLSPDEPDAADIARWCQAARLRQSIPVIITTHNRPTLEASHYQELGAHTIINQPFRSRYLLKTLQSLLVSAQPVKDLVPVQPSTQPSASGDSLEADLSNTTLLVADDNEINRILLKSQLSKTGAIIMEAKDGKEALEKVRSVAFDLVFLDLQMPVMNGIDIVRNLKTSANANRKTPIIAITAHALPEQKAAVLEAGFTDCLIKPIFQDQLLTIIERWLPHLKLPENAYIAEINPANQYLDLMLEQTNGNKELTHSILSKLFAELPQQLQQIRLALAHSNLKAAQNITHQLHGSVSFCQISTVKKPAQALETMLKSTKPDDLNRLFEELEEEGNKFLQMKEEILESLSMIT